MQGKMKKERKKSRGLTGDTACSVGAIACRRKDIQELGGSIS
jgi:hypothetical protein